MTEKSIPGKALERLPFGHFVKFATVHDMDEVERDAVVWLFRNEMTFDFRKAYFDRRTGDYIAECGC